MVTGDKATLVLVTTWNENVAYLVVNVQSFHFKTIFKQIWWYLKINLFSVFLRVIGSRSRSVQRSNPGCNFQTNCVVWPINHNTLFVSFCIVWKNVALRKRDVKLWPVVWLQTPPTWESWTSARINFKMKDWSYFQEFSTDALWKRWGKMLAAHDLSVLRVVELQHKVCPEGGQTRKDHVVIKGSRVHHRGKDISIFHNSLSFLV